VLPFSKLKAAYFKGYACIISFTNKLLGCSMIKPPSRKLPNSYHRDAFGGSRSDHREFLYLHEVDALIAAIRQTRAPIATKL